MSRMKGECKCVIIGYSAMFSFFLYCLLQFFYIWYVTSNTDERYSFNPNRHLRGDRAPGGAYYDLAAAAQSL